MKRMYGMTISKSSGKEEVQAEGHSLTGERFCQKGGSHNTCSHTFRIDIAGATHRFHQFRSNSVALPHSRSRRNVARSDRIVRPPQARIVCIVCSRERNQGPRLSITTAGNFDLRTRQIHLRATD